MNEIIDITGVELRAPRVQLRPFRETDLDDLYEYARVDGVGQMAGWNPHRSRRESRDVLDMFLRERRTFAIVRARKVIGSVGLERARPEELPEFTDLRGLELGFVLAKPCWGIGLMPEAVRAVAKWLFTEQSMDFLACVYLGQNDRSRRVQEKCGFVRLRPVTRKTLCGTTEQGWVSVLRREDFLG